MKRNDMIILLIINIPNKTLYLLISFHIFVDKYIELFYIHYVRKQSFGQS